MENYNFSQGNNQDSGEDKLEPVFLVGVHLPDCGEEDFSLSMQELWDLAEACNMKVVGKTEQKLTRPNMAYYIGSGKVAEVAEARETAGAQTVIFDNTLSPTQIRNLQNELQCPVMDRTALILEIFEKRAKSREAKLQVETVKLQYMLPRLVGMHEALSRQGGGGFANKGSGEKKLELDRRKLEHRLHELRKELEKIKNERITQRKRRNDTGAIRVALVGYTNAGKSTLMNAMLENYSAGKDFSEDKKVFEEDMLFATLDTTVRRIAPPGRIPFLLSDTVGFISGLPHSLIDAFHSTLEEAVESDLLLQVVDFSDFHRDDQINVTNRTLKELGAGDLPIIYVYNKADLCMEETKLPIVKGNRIYLSAGKRIGLQELLDLMEDALSSYFKEGEFLFPYALGNEVAYLQESAAVSYVEYLEDGIKIKAKLRVADYGRLKKYLS